MMGNRIRYRLWFYGQKEADMEVNSHASGLANP
jgi:hypothetical protein